MNTRSWVLVFVGGWVLGLALAFGGPVLRAEYAEREARALPFPEGALEELAYGNVQSSPGLYARREASYPDTWSGEELVLALEANLSASGWHIDDRWTPPNPGEQPYGSVWVVEARRGGASLTCAAGAPTGALTGSGLAGPKVLVCTLYL